MPGCRRAPPHAVALPLPPPPQALAWPLRSQSLTGALGLAPRGGARALAGPLLRTLCHAAALFALPLWHKLSAPPPRGGPLRALRGWLAELRAAASWAHGDAEWFLHVLGRPVDDAHLWVWRNVVVSPVAEEFVFRACMAPLLLLAVSRRRSVGVAETVGGLGGIGSPRGYGALGEVPLPFRCFAAQGCSQWVVIWATPLFFGAAHLHHLADLVRHRRVKLKQAVLMVRRAWLLTSPSRANRAGWQACVSWASPQLAL